MLTVDQFDNKYMVSFSNITKLNVLNSSEIEALTASFSKIRFAISEPEASIHKNVMRKALMVLSVLFVVFVLPSTANAHRGARNEPEREARPDR